MDWKQIIAKLQEAKITQAEIARRVGCSQASISDLAVGKTYQPNYALGVAILALISADGSPAIPADKMAA